jgi:hypothetical protein
LDCSFDIVDHGVISGLDTAVIGIDRLVRADRRMHVFQGFLLIDEDRDILEQGSLNSNRPVKAAG